MPALAATATALNPRVTKQGYGGSAIAEVGPRRPGKRRAPVPSGWSQKARSAPASGVQAASTSSMDGIPLREPRVSCTKAP